MVEVGGRSSVSLLPVDLRTGRNWTTFSIRNFIIGNFERVEVVY